MIGVNITLGRKSGRGCILPGVVLGDGFMQSGWVRQWCLMARRYEFINFFCIALFSQDGWGGAARGCVPAEALT